MKNRLCELCNGKITVIRQVKGGKHRKKIVKIFSDKKHTLCGRCHRGFQESNNQIVWNQ